jgi:hypothetical protein
MQRARPLRPVSDGQPNKNINIELNLELLLTLGTGGSVAKKNVVAGGNCIASCEVALFSCTSSAKPIDLYPTAENNTGHVHEPHLRTRDVQSQG